MNVGLFTPCYIDAFFTEVGIATLELVEKLGCSVEYSLGRSNDQLEDDPVSASVPPLRAAEAGVLCCERKKATRAERSS